MFSLIRFLNGELRLVPTHQLRFRRSGTMIFLPTTNQEARVQLLFNGDKHILEGISHQLGTPSGIRVVIERLQVPVSENFESNEVPHQKNGVTNMQSDSHCSDPDGNLRIEEEKIQIEESILEYPTHMLNMIENVHNLETEELQTGEKVEAVTFSPNAVELNDDFTMLLLHNERIVNDPCFDILCNVTENEEISNFSREVTIVESEQDTEKKNKAESDMSCGQKNVKSKYIFDSSSDLSEAEDLYAHVELSEDEFRPSECEQSSSSADWSTSEISQTPTTPVTLESPEDVGTRVKYASNGEVSCKRNLFNVITNTDVEEIDKASKVAKRRSKAVKRRSKALSSSKEMVKSPSTAASLSTHYFCADKQQSPKIIHETDTEVHPVTSPTLVPQSAFNIHDDAKSGNSQPSCSKKSIGSPSIRQTLATLQIVGDVVTAVALHTIHRGSYKGSFFNSVLFDAEKTLKAVILANPASDNHFCNFQSDKHHSAVLTREGFKFVWETVHCLQEKTRLVGSEMRIPGSKIVTCLSMAGTEDTLQTLYQDKLKLKKSKQHCCPYCTEMQTALSRHLRTKHKNEPRVRDLMQKEVNSKERNDALRKLRIEGDNKYNVKIGRLDPSLRIPVRKPVTQSVANFRYCPGCQALIGKKKFTRHERKCTNRLPTRERVERQSIQHPSELKDTSAVDLLLQSLRTDEIGQQIRSDPTIKLLAQHYMYDGETLPHRRSNVRSHLRRVCRLLEEVKKLDPNVKELKDLIRPGKYDTIMDGIRNLCNLKCTSNVQKPKLALQFGPIISNTCSRLLIHYLKQEIPDTDPVVLRLKNFQNIHHMDFKTQITRRALIMSTLRKMKKTYELPSAADIAKFTEYLTDTAKSCFEKLNEKFDIHTWRLLGECILCQIIVFNRRRVGEASKILVVDYSNRKKIEENDYEHMSRLQIILARRFSVMYIVGKRVRPLPVLLNPTQERQIDAYVRHRREAGVSDDNQFLFGIPGHRGHLEASQLLPAHAKKSQVERPDLIRGTMLRRQVATVSQFLNLNDSEIQELADFMGHDPRVHRQYYRQPHLLLEVTKISRFLSVVGDVHVENYRGKKLDELEPYIPPEDYDEEDIYDDGDLVKNYLPKSSYAEPLDLDIDANEERILDVDVDAGINVENVALQLSGPSAEFSDSVDIGDSNVTCHSDTEQRGTGTTGQEGTSPDMEIGQFTKKLNLTRSTENIPAPTPVKSVEQRTPKKKRIKLTTPKKKSQTVAEVLEIVNQQRSPLVYRQRKRRIVLHRAGWSKEEKSFMKKAFREYLIPNNPLPSKDFCEHVLNCNRDKLKSTRTRDNMYAWIQNERRKRGKP